MTSRREFFGLLAAAPLVAPAVAKELASTAMTPNAIRSMAGFTPILPDYFGSSEGETIYYRPMSSGFPVVRNAKPGRYHFEKPTHLDMEDGRQIYAIGDCVISQLEPDVLTDDPGYYFKPLVAPNRLYGAQINADGDAV
jgi:hypothetical protein